MTDGCSIAHNKHLNCLLDPTPEAINIPKYSKYAQFFKCKILTLTRPDGGKRYRVTLPKPLVESGKVGELIYGWFELDKMRDQIIFYYERKISGDSIA